MTDVYRGHRLSFDDSKGLVGLLKCSVKANWDRLNVTTPNRTESTCPKFHFLIVQLILIQTKYSAEGAHSLLYM